MTNHGDDCYFFYYSNCSKGDSCPFRHCEAAMGSETTCNLWEEGRCFRAVCKFRHMEITKNRKVIHCYWENQPAGCQKPHCAFFHAKPRCIDGMFVPADKSPSKNEEQQQEEESPPPAAPLPAAANPQLRGVIKTEAQEPVPSPTHPPVVINPADDDEDEDDQFSEEGEDGKVGPSPRKLAKTGEYLNFGVSTLEEIRLRKALKASMKRAGYPIQSADTSDNLGKENIQSFFRPSLYEERDESLVFGESGRPRGSVAERLGRRMPSHDGEGVSMKRSLADRLGSVVDDDDEEPSMPPQKVLKPVRERLGRSAGSVAPTPPAETSRESRKAPERIRIKTLEEIRQEKAAKCQSGGDGPSVQAPHTNTTKSISPKATKAVKQAGTTTKDNYKTAVKTFSEILHAKKKGQQQERAKAGVEKASAKSQPECGPAEAVSDGGVRVKTLEEIRRDKAARMQAQQTADNNNNNNKTSDTEESSAKKPRLLRTSKLPAQTGTTTTGEKKEKSADVTEKPVKSPMAVPQNGAANGKSVKVKTFEEIMREKRNRRQEMEEEAKSSAEAEPGQTQSTEGSLKRKSPARVTFTMAASPRVVPTDTSLPTLKPSVGKRLHITSKASTPVISPTAPALSSLPETCSLSLGSSTTVSPAEHQNTLNNNHKEYTADTKVRPKLNVKPSVMKPAVQVKPGQKRRGAQRSAVAAVKPLLSTSTGPEEPLQDTPCTDTQVFPSSCAEAQLSSAVPQSPSPLLDSSPLREDLQTVPVFTHSQESKPTVPQSSVLKTAAQAKSRRLSVGAPRTVSTSSTALSSSAVDDFDDLMNEFTEDHLEGDMDPGIGEDDLLQELSEMIDS